MNRSLFSIPSRTLSSHTREISKSYERLVEPRQGVQDVSPFLAKIRNFLLGRKHASNNRNQETQLPRSPPIPDLPEGPHQLSDKAKNESRLPPTPGRTYLWDNNQKYDCC